MFAHFEEDEGKIEGTPRRHTVTPPKSGFPHHDRRQFPTSPLEMLDEVGLPVRPHEQSMLQSIEGPAIVPGKRSRTEEDLCPGLHEVACKPIGNDFAFHGEHNNSNYGASVRDRLAPPMLTPVTLENHAIDYAQCKGHNAAPNEFGYRSDWNVASAQRHIEVAHARLIHGIYGIPSPIRCQRCVQEGLDCRVYHPTLMLSEACGNCRLNGEPCVMGGLNYRSQHNSAKRQRRSGFTALNVSNSNSTSTSPAISAIYFCSFEGCQRGVDGFSNKPNFDRHVRVMHPGVTVIPQSTPVVDSSLVCPVTSCTFSFIAQFSKGRVIEAHIRDCHPDHVQPRDNSSEHDDHESFMGDGPQVDSLRTQISQMFNPDLSVSDAPDASQSLAEESLSGTSTLQRRFYDCMKELRPPCPMPYCGGRSASGFARPDVLVSHIRRCHPDHTYLLEQYKKTTSDYEQVSSGHYPSARIQTRSQSDTRPRHSSATTTDSEPPSRGLIPGRFSISNKRFSHKEPVVRHVDNIQLDQDQDQDQDQAPANVEVQAIPEIRNGRKEYGCPVVGCDQTRTYFPFSNLKQHLTHRHPGVLLKRSDELNPEQTTLAADLGSIWRVANGEDVGFGDSVDSNRHIQSSPSTPVIHSDIPHANVEKIAAEMSNSSNKQEIDSKERAAKATFTCPVAYCTAEALPHDRFHMHLWFAHPDLRLTEILRAGPDSVTLSSRPAQADALDAAAVQPLAINRRAQQRVRAYTGHDSGSQDLEDDEDDTASSIRVIDLDFFSSTDDDLSNHDSEETASFHPASPSPKGSDEYESDESEHDEDETDEGRHHEPRASPPHAIRHNPSEPETGLHSSDRTPNVVGSVRGTPYGRVLSPQASSSLKKYSLPPPTRMQPQHRNEGRIEPKSIAQIRSNMSVQRTGPNRLSAPNVRPSPFKDRSHIADMLLGTPIRGQTPREPSQSATPAQIDRHRLIGYSPYGQNSSNSRTFDEMNANRNLFRGQMNNDNARVGARAGGIPNETNAGTSDVGNSRAVSEEAILQAEISQQYESDGDSLFC